VHFSTAWQLVNPHLWTGKTALEKEPAGRVGGKQDPCLFRMKKCNCRDRSSFLSGGWDLDRSIHISDRGALSLLLWCGFDPERISGTEPAQGALAGGLPRRGLINISIYMNRSQWVQLAWKRMKLFAAGPRRRIPRIGIIFVV
jgi:hypothetical protein